MGIRFGRGRISETKGDRGRGKGFVTEVIRMGIENEGRKDVGER